MELSLERELQRADRPMDESLVDELIDGLHPIFVSRRIMGSHEREAARKYVVDLIEAERAQHSPDGVAFYKTFGDVENDVLSFLFGYRAAVDDVAKLLDMDRSCSGAAADADSGPQ